MKKVWLVTACSTGFGRAIATEALRSGALVGIEARNPEDVADIVAAFPDTALPLRFDITNRCQMRGAVMLMRDIFGHVDVLVNNAGMGYFDAVEESEDGELRRMWEVNFWGLTEMARQVLPIMQARRCGHIIHISSIGGLKSWPSPGYYHATKYAVDGLSEGLAKEVEPFGIKVTIVAPDGFQTDWVGDPAMAARAILRMVDNRHPPMRLVLSGDANL